MKTIHSPRLTNRCLESKLVNVSVISSDLAQPSLNYDPDFFLFPASHFLRLREEKNVSLLAFGIILLRSKEWWFINEKLSTRVKVLALPLLMFYLFFFYSLFLSLSPNNVALGFQPRLRNGRTRQVLLSFGDGIKDSWQENLPTFELFFLLFLFSSLSLI